MCFGGEEVDLAGVVDEGIAARRTAAMAKRMEVAGAERTADAECESRDPGTLPF
jgi:hypothetical protein